MNYGVNYGSLEQIRAYLDYLHEKGLYIIYSLKDMYRHSHYELLSVGPFKGEEAVVKGIPPATGAAPAVGQ